MVRIIYTEVGTRVNYRAQVPKGITQYTITCYGCGGRGGNGVLNSDGLGYSGGGGGSGFISQRTFTKSSTQDIILDIRLSPQSEVLLGTTRLLSALNGNDGGSGIDNQGGIGTQNGSDGEPIYPSVLSALGGRGGASFLAGGGAGGTYSQPAGGKGIYSSGGGGATLNAIGGNGGAGVVVLEY